MLAHMLRVPGSPGGIAINITVQTANINLFEAAGRPSSPATVTLTIAPGVLVWSESSSRPALTTGTGWAPGSVLRVINRGTIMGVGGDGGNGGGPSLPDTTAFFPIAGYSGGRGGDALEVLYPIEIQNIGGIYAGGGGGGGGGAAGILIPTLIGVASAVAGGGGGGGGQGAGSSPAGVSYSDHGWPSSGVRQAFVGQSGVAGNSFSSGVGGPGADVTTSPYHFTGGAGGTGGTFGQPGSPGGPGVVLDAEPDGVPYTAPGGPGGLPGFAVRLNGNTISWLSGFNATQVKGSVA